MNLGPVPRKMIKLNPGLSQILSKVFLSEDMQLEFIVEPFWFRHTVMITQNNAQEGKIQKRNKNFNPG